LAGDIWQIGIGILVISMCQFLSPGAVLCSVLSHTMKLSLLLWLSIFCGGQAYFLCDRKSELAAAESLSIQDLGRNWPTKTKEEEKK
jgi:hypothetical protein